MERKVTEIREISRKEYDVLVAGQQAFFDSLIKAGKARIVEEGTAKPDVGTEPAVLPQKQPTPPPKQPTGTDRKVPVVDPIRRFVGQRVTATLINGMTVEGHLDEDWRYEVVIDGVVVLKHAIVSVHPTPESASRREPVDGV